MLRKSQRPAIGAGLFLFARILKAEGSAEGRGFTLVELVTVLVILGVLGAVVAPRFASLGAFDASAAKKQLLTGLRYAQQQAMSRRGGVKVCFSGSDYGIYSASADCDSDPTPLDPRNGRGSLRGDVVITGKSELLFNGLGALSSEPACDDEELDLRKGDQVFATIQVDCYTGFPHDPDS